MVHCSAPGDLLTLTITIGDNQRLSVHSRSDRVQTAQMSQPRIETTLTAYQII